MAYGEHYLLFLFLIACAASPGPYSQNLSTSSALTNYQFFHIKTSYFWNYSDTGSGGSRQ
jgi:hypothetical protein